MTVELHLPPGWTLTEQARVVGHEDADSAFTDGRQLTLLDPAGVKPPQGEWPTSWRAHAIAYAWSVQARREAELVDEQPPPYAAGPANAAMLPAAPPVPGIATPSGPVEFRRKWQLAGEPVHPVTEPYVVPAGGRILFSVPVDNVISLAALCRPASSALGVTQKTPLGLVGDGWRWAAIHGAGLEPSTGRITESVLLKLQRGARLVLFLWIRPVPDPVLMIALNRMLRRWFSPVGVGWVREQLPALLRELRPTTWKNAFQSGWNAGPDGRPDDTPERLASADAKSEVRS
jgi:hypothetical protein